jgi:alkylhydroperoxidase family enzyme
MGERPLPARTPEENRQTFEHLFQEQLGFPELPPGYRLLELCPEVFDAQLRVIERSVAVVPRDRWMRIGLVVARLTNSAYFGQHCGAWLAQRGTDPAEVIAASEGAGSRLPEAEECCLRFTRDLTLHSHTIAGDRIDELRARGLSDGAILDLAYVAAVFNGIVRYIRVLGAMERLTSDEQPVVEQKATA